MMSPLAFAGVLIFIAISICLKNSSVFDAAKNSPQVSITLSKLISMFIVIFCFLYLTVTRRALDIFNCNPQSRMMDTCTLNSQVLSALVVLAYVMILQAYKPN